MKPKALIAGGLLCGSLFVSGVDAYAAINGNEAELLAIINSTREYNGVLYQVAPEYRQSARAYLDDPSIDCTDEQKQKAINQMFGSIQQGIDEGYLIPVGGAASGGNSGSSSNVSETEAPAAPNPTATADNTGGGAAAAGTGEAAQAAPNPTAQAAESPETAGGQEAAVTETVPETEPVTEAETEPSPIVLALEAAMNAPQEDSAAMEAGSLLPEAVYPARAMQTVSIVSLVGAAAGAGLSLFFGLFHHRHKKHS